MGIKNRLPKFSRTTLSYAAGIITAIVGLLVLIGWMFDLQVFKSVYPGFVTMKANTAIAFLLSGVALLLFNNEQSTKWQRTTAQVLSGTVAFLGGLTLCQYVLEIDFGIDQLLFKEASGAVGTSQLGRMAPNTAISFIFIGIALSLLNNKSARYFFFSQLLIFFSALITWAALLGYFYGIEESYGIAGYTKMALHTSLTFLLLSVGILFARSDRGLIAALINENSSSVLMRRLFLAVIFLPAVVGWLRWEGELKGFYSTTIGLILMVLGTTVILSIIILLATVAINRADSDRMQAVEQLKKLSLAVEQSPDYVVITDRKGNIEYVNPKFTQVTGYVREEVIGKNPRILRSEDSPPQLYKELWETIASGKEWKGELRNKKKNGEFYWERISISPIVNTKGDITHFVAVNEDITERKRAKEVLRVSEERYRTLFETMDEGFCVVEMLYNPDGKAVDYRFVEINPAFEKHTGLQHALGKTIRQMVPDHDAHWFEIYGNVARTGEAIRFEDPAVAMQRYYDVFAFRIGGDGSPRVGILFNDITKNKQHEEALQHLNKELEAFSYTVSHDLRAPLRHIDGFIELLKKKIIETADDSVKRYLNIISQASKKLSNLIDELLAYSRTGRTKLIPKEVDLNELVKEVLTELKSQMENRKITWQIDQLPKIQTDYNLIKLVYQNLLNNSIKFSQHKEEAVIQLTAREENGKHILGVKDNGAGFDMAYSGRLFGVFQRLHREDEFEGTGIGLANVRRIVHMHSGDIWAEGKVNEGAEFTFSIPKEFNNG